MSGAYVDYNQRYVAFLDVLGFSNLVSRLAPEDTSELFRIYLALNATDLVENTIELAKDEKSHLTTTYFSDNVVASSPLSADGLFQLLFFCYNFAWIMLVNGYLCRGAVVKGRLCHDHNVVFGKGLVDAYQMESNVADVARIVISRHIVNDLENQQKNHALLSELSEHVLQAQDGPFYLNFLMPISRLHHRWQIKKNADYEVDVSLDEDEAYRDIVRRNVRAIIEKHLTEGADQPHVFAKVKWLAEQFNQWATDGNLSSDQIKIYNR